MRYHVLATDYDGTIAHDGIVAPSTVSSLERLAASGRKLVLVTGRELPDLQEAFPELELFDRVVTENGALLYRPGTREERLLTEPADERLAKRLRDDGVSPLSVGRAIVATWEPNDGAVLDAIRELGLELEIIFNKGAVMVLPAGVTKATGLQAALLELGLSAHDAVGVGDAENDHAFLTLCEMAAAVANALPALKDRCDLVLDRDHGAGVEELVERLLAEDLATLAVSDGEALAWALATKDAEPIPFRPARPEGERQRHRRKYASGVLGPDKSFWFRGPDDRLNLRAQNLTLFLQLADGIDDETWLYHLRQGEYSAWIKESINDPELAADVAAVEEDRALRTDESRERIREVVEERYTAPV